MSVLLTLLARFLLMLGRWLYGLRIQGADNIPPTGPYLVVFNHAGLVGDTLTLAFLYLQRRNRALNVYADLGFFPHNDGLVPRMMQRAGVRLIAGLKAPGTSMPALRRALRILKQGEAITLAAEGEMSWDGRPQPLQGGAAWMALRSGAPVVPVLCKGGYDVMPRWSRWPRLTGQITLHIGEPFYIGGGNGGPITRQDIVCATREIWNRMAALLDNQGEGQDFQGLQEPSEILESRQKE